MLGKNRFWPSSRDNLTKGKWKEWKNEGESVTYHSHCCPPVQQKCPWWGWESSSSPEVWSPQSDVKTNEWYPGWVVEKWHKHTLLILESLRWETPTALNDWSTITMAPPLCQSQSNILLMYFHCSLQTCPMQPSTNKVASITLWDDLPCCCCCCCLRKPFTCA